MSRTFRSSERADVVMRSQDQTGAFAAEKRRDRLDFFRRSLLLRDHVVETEHEQRIRVGEHPLVERAAGTRPDRPAGTPGPACPVVSPTSSWNGTNARKKSSSVPAIPCWKRSGIRILWCLKVRPSRPANLGHRREAVVQLRHVPVGLPGITPGEVDADPSFARQCIAVGRGPGCRSVRVGSMCSFQFPFLLLCFSRFGSGDHRRASRGPRVGPSLRPATTPDHCI